MVIIVDVHEPKQVLDGLKRDGVEVRTQDIGFWDYLITYKEYIIGVERKEASDFVSSIIDGRIFNQAYMLSTLFPVSYIVVEGIISEALMERRFPRRAYIGALSSLALKRSPYGQRGHISIIMLESIYDTIAFLSLLHKQVTEGKFDRLPKLNVQNKKYIDKIGVMIAMLQAIPGVGQERAKRIAERFGGMEALMKATPAMIASVEGVSIDLARKIYSYLH